MENIAFDIWLSDRLKFGSEDKRDCFETAKKMVHITAIARKDGLTAAAEEVKEMHDIFLEIAVKLAVDGFSSQRIKTVMQNYIIAGNYRGGALLKRILVTETIMLIVHGYSPKQICEELASFFGEDFYKEYMAYCGVGEVDGGQ